MAPAIALAPPLGSDGEGIVGASRAFGEATASGSAPPGIPEAMVGRRIDGAWLAIGLIALPAGASARAPDPGPRSPTYSVTMIHAPYAANAGVGARRAGLMCLPQGAVHWRELSARDDRWSIALIEDALAQAGLVVDRSARATASNVLVRGELRRVMLRVCARHWGLGDPSSLDGDGVLQMEWRVLDDGGVPHVHVSSVSRHVDRHQATTAVDLYEMLLVDAAADLAVWLKTDEARAAPPAPATARH